MSIARTTRGGAAHWNGPPLGLTRCTGHSCRLVVASIRRYHLGKGWRDVAYNHLICPGCGTIHDGRGWGARSASNGTTAANRDWHGWMVLSGVGEPFTDPAKRGLLTLHREHARRYGRSRLTTHHAVRGGTTACPGPAIRAWIAAGAPAPDVAPVLDPLEEWYMALTPARRKALDRILDEVNVDQLVDLLGRLTASDRAWLGDMVTAARLEDDRGARVGTRVGQLATLNVEALVDLVTKLTSSDREALGAFITALRLAGDPVQAGRAVAALTGR